MAREDGDSQGTDLSHPVNPNDSVLMPTKGSKSEKLQSSAHVERHTTIQQPSDNLCYAPLLSNADRFTKLSI